MTTATTASPNGRRAAAERMAVAAEALLTALDADQAARAHWPFPSDGERERWFYTPTDHGGLTLGAMRPGQQRLAHRLLASGLSTAGYVTGATIMGLENVLDHTEGWTAGFGHERGRDPSRYYMRVFGEPGGAEPWAWRFGGHHVSIHHTVVGGEVVAPTPCFFGADPASSPLLGPHPLRPLAGAEDLARVLVRSLDEAQAALAVVSAVPPVDLVGANRSRLAEGDLPLPLPDIWRERWEGDRLAMLSDRQRQAEAALGLTPAHLDAVRYTTAAKGLPATALTAEQCDLLRALLDVYLGRLPDDLADAEADKVAGGQLHALHLAWAGGTEPGQPHYYRIQGPRVVVEYANVVNAANHVHSVWRDPDNDFGFGSLAAHVRQHH